MIVRKLCFFYRKLTGAQYQFVVGFVGLTFPVFLLNFSMIQKNFTFYSFSYFLNWHSMPGQPKYSVPNSFFQVYLFLPFPLCRVFISMLSESLYFLPTFQVT